MQRDQIERRNRRKETIKNNKMQRSEMKMKTKRNAMETMKDNVHVQCPPNGQATPAVGVVERGAPLIMSNPTIQPVTRQNLDGSCEVKSKPETTITTR